METTTEEMNFRTSNDSHSRILTRRILVVEDDKMLRKMIERFLAVNYYRVVPVSNGLDGLHAVLKEDFDFIICDIVMPKMSGDMFYLSVKKMKPRLCSRFIFITGYGGDPKIINFIKSVNGIVLLKPFQMIDLLEAVTLVQVDTPHRHRLNNLSPNIGRCNKSESRLRALGFNSAPTLR